MLFVVIHKSAQSYNISHTYTSPAQKKPDRSWKPHQNVLSNNKCNFVQS